MDMVDLPQLLVGFAVPQALLKNNRHSQYIPFTHIFVMVTIHVVCFAVNKERRIISSKACQILANHAMIKKHV